MRIGFVNLASVASLGLVVLHAPDVFAAGDLINKGHGMVAFLSQKLGPIIIGLGLIGGAAALSLGIPGAVQKILAVVVGGVLITSVGSIITLITSF